MGTGEAVAVERENLSNAAPPKALLAHFDDWLGHRWVGGLLFAAAAVVPLLRQQGTPSWQTVWAEDGTIYTHQAVFGGGVHSLFRGYYGYLQLPPRLIALPTPYFSLRYLALYMSFAATITGALLAWSLFHLTRSWLPSRLLRGTLASFVVLAPALGIESTATVTNTIWMFLAVLPWALVSLEERTRDTALRCALVFLGATSTLLSVVFLPVAIGWVAYRRTRSAWTVGIAFFAGLLVQTIVALSARQSTIASRAGVLAEATSVRVFGAFFLGTRWESAWWRADWLSLVVLGPLAFLVLLLALGTRADRRAQAMATVFTLLAVIVFAVPAWERGTLYLKIGPSSLAPKGWDYWGESRFSIVPVLLLASAVAILLSSNPPLVRRFGIPTFAIWTLVLMVACFSQNGLRGQDPSWASRVDRVLITDCSCRPPSIVVTVPNLISPAPPLFPHGVPGGFYPVVLRCSNLQ